jgi:peroxiredoxin (alkyl hydroperoxide reductase subunit C)
MTSAQLQNSPQAGDIAPEFTAPSTSGSDVSLSSFRGNRNVLLAFFPLAFTGTCTKQLVCFTGGFDQFAGKGVEILPISVDSTYSDRAYFLIDMDGRVRWSHVESNNGQRRENSEILAAIKLLS